MGMNLRRPNFLGWMTDAVRLNSQKRFVKALSKHLGHAIPYDHWGYHDADFPKIGTYTAYGLFCLCLKFITEGDFAAELHEDDDIELEALKQFREELVPGMIEIPGSEHLIDAENESLFVPTDFSEPFHYLRTQIMSKPQATQALDAFARHLNFDLNGEFEDEGSEEQTNYLAVSRNVARIIYQFFQTHPVACVEFA